MFRGGIADSDGVGITSGLDNKYADGGRVGFANGPSYFDVISPYSKQFGTSIIDPVKEYEKKISQIQKETQDTGYMYDPSGLTPITPGRNRTLKEIELSTEKGKEEVRIAIEKLISETFEDEIKWEPFKGYGNFGSYQENLENITA
jgi:hypothetical protein